MLSRPLRILAREQLVRIHPGNIGEMINHMLRPSAADLPHGSGPDLLIEFVDFALVGVVVCDDFGLHADRRMSCSERTWVMGSWEEMDYFLFRLTAPLSYERDGCHRPIERVSSSSNIVLLHLFDAQLFWPVMFVGSLRKRKEKEKMIGRM
jgi:hypothetical protein